MEEEKTALLCVLGGREDSAKELLAMDPGYRESKESWGDELRDVRDRGLEAPLVATGDGALRLWAALDEVYPTTEHQRCWNHRIANVQAKLPKRGQAEARRRQLDGPGLGRRDFYKRRSPVPADPQISYRGTLITL